MDVLVGGVFATWAVVALLGLFRPGCVLALIMSFFVVEQVFAYRFASLYLSNRMAIDILTGGVTLICLFSNRAISVRRFPRAVWIGLGLFLLCLVSAAWSVAPNDTITRWLEIFPLTVLYAVLAPMCIRKDKDFYDFQFSFVILGTAICLVFLFGDRSGRGLALLTDTGHTELGPLAAAQFAGMLSIISCFMFVSPSNFRSSSLTKKVFLAAAVILGVYILASTGSRGQLVAMAPILLLWMPTVVSGKKISKGSTIAMVFGFAVCYIGYEIVTAFGFDDRWQERHIRSGLESRFTMASMLWNSYIEGGPFVWIFGLGSSSSYSLVGFYCHITALETLCELGFFGFVLLIAYVYFLVKLSSQVIFTCQDTRLRIAVGSISAIAFYDIFLSFKQGALLSGTTFGYCNCALVAVYAVSKVNRRDLLNDTVKRSFDNKSGHQDTSSLFVN